MLTVRWPRVGPVICTARNEDLTSIKHSSAHEAATRIGGIDELTGLGELDHTLLEVVEWTLDQNTGVFVFVEQVVP